MDAFKLLKKFYEFDFKINQLKVKRQKLELEYQNLNKDLNKFLNDKEVAPVFRKIVNDKSFIAKLKKDNPKLYQNMRKSKFYNFWKQHKS